MKRISNIWKKHSLWIMFLLVIFVVGGANTSNLYNSVKTQYISRTLDTSIVETSYEDNFWHHENFINLQGWIAKASGQMINNGVIKGLDGSLHLLEDVEYTFDAELEQKNCNDTIEILKTAEETGASILYVQRAYKTGELPYGYTFQRDKQYEFWGKAMENVGIPVLDIKKELGDYLQFYKTDHHWTVESSFYAAKMIVHELNQHYGMDLANDALEHNKYDTMVWKDSFLGSMGIRTGKYYAGKDDFIMLNPKFETYLTYEHFINGELDKKKEGDFLESFVDLSILNDAGYNNKYNACLNGGYVENIIINHQQPEGLKVLVISDSFARPMVQYMSLCFGETRYLDPQEGRYNDSYVEYIKDYNPDVVVVMYSGAYVEI